MSNLLRVRDWTKFQHYKDRNPPWIKLHYELMASEHWVMLPDASKLLAVVCMMVASRNEGCVPNNSRYIQKMANLDAEVDFKPLIACGFLVSVADASTVLADAIIEAETETYIEETDKKEAKACGFRWKPATHSDAKPASVPI